MTLLDQARTFLGAMAAHVAAGCPVVTAEQLAARLTICGGCEHFDVHRVRCMSCGCYLDRKAAWADQACPLDPPRWGPVEPTTAG